MSQAIDEALVLGSKPFGERQAIGVFFGGEWGVFRGLVGVNKSTRGVLMAGNVVRVERWRRLDSQLGKLTVESVWNGAHLALGDGPAPLLVGWLVELLETLLPEEHAYPQVYEAALSMLKSGVDGGLGHRVAEFERRVLAEVGYGLALAEDPVVASAGEALAWVSPNSGRAVGVAAGAAYADRLMVLPAFWGGAAREDADDVAAALKITGHFLAQAAHGKGGFAARGRLVRRLGGGEVGK